MNVRRARRRICWLTEIALACLLAMGAGAPPLHLSLILRQHVGPAAPTATLTPTRTPTRAG